MPAPMPMPDRPAHILETALYAADLDAAEGFYGGVLGLERAARAGDRHVFFRLAGAMLLIFNPAETERPPTGLPVPPHGARGPGHLAFAASATDLDAWRARLVAAGVAIEADFLWPNGARFDLRARPRRQLHRAHGAGPLGLRPRVRRGAAPSPWPNTQAHHHHTRARLRASTRPRRDPAPSPWRKCAADAAAREGRRSRRGWAGGAARTPPGLGPGSSASPPQRHPIAADLDPREAVEVGHAEKRGLRARRRSRSPRPRCRRSRRTPRGRAATARAAPHGPRGRSPLVGGDQPPSSALRSSSAAPSR